MDPLQRDSECTRTGCGAFHLLRRELAGHVLDWHSVGKALLQCIEGWPVGHIDPQHTDQFSAVR